MKKYLMWSFERGSRPYDAICAIILGFIFLTPSWVFHDRPDFMRIEEGTPVRRAKDSNGSPVYTVQESTEDAALARLHEYVHEKFEVSRKVPLYDTKGKLIAYAIWIQTGVQPL